MDKGGTLIEPRPVAAAIGDSPHCRVEAFVLLTYPFPKVSGRILGRPRSSSWQLSYPLYPRRRQSAPLIMALAWLDAPPIQPRWYDPVQVFSRQRLHQGDQVTNRVRVRAA